MQVEIDKKAQKAFVALPVTLQKRLKEAILELKNFPNVSNIKKLSNFDPAYRKRVGDYRILFDAQDATLTIYEIKHRKDAYES